MCRNPEVEIPRGWTLLVAGLETGGSQGGLGKALQTMWDFIPKAMRSLQSFFNGGVAICSDCILKRSF